jgi:hypothetical protein
MECSTNLQTHLNWLWQTDFGYFKMRQFTFDQIIVLGIVEISKRCYGFSHTRFLTSGTCTKYYFFFLIKNHNTFLSNRSVALIVIWNLAVGLVRCCNRLSSRTLIRHKSTFKKLKFLPVTKKNPLMEYRICVITTSLNIIWKIILGYQFPFLKKFLSNFKR